MWSFTSFCSVTLLPELAINFVKFNVSWECIFRVEDDIGDVRMSGYLSVVLIMSFRRTMILASVWREVMMAQILSK